ncbi:MAG: hypothetical protein L3J63_02260 [Geopsychrobacter sp.]|nr:hypothetical protein [Geopsychrobacter sp.]
MSCLAGSFFDVYSSGAIPSTPSIALEVAARLAQLTGDIKWSQHAGQLLRGAANEVKRYPQGFPHLLLAAERLLGKSRELVIVGRREAPRTQAMLKTLQQTNPPLTSLLFIDTENPQPITKLAPFAAAMHQLRGQTTAYLCENHACGQPLIDPDLLRKQLTGGE